MTQNEQQVIHATRAWLEKAVIGLNLCPFAKAVHVKQQIRYVVSAAQTEQALLEHLLDELHLLYDADAEDIDTTLLIHPDVLTDFLDFNDFLEVAEAAANEVEFDGALQVASFHPQFQFADTLPDDIGNYTNRSPYPMLHLLREDSIDRAVEAYPDAATIYERNIVTLTALGHTGWLKLFGVDYPRPGD